MTLLKTLNIRFSKPCLSPQLLEIKKNCKRICWEYWNTCMVSQKTDVHIKIIKKGDDIFAEFLTIKTLLFSSSFPLADATTLHKSLEIKLWAGKNYINSYFKYKNSFLKYLIFQPLHFDLVVWILKKIQYSVFILVILERWDNSFNRVKFKSKCKKSGYWTTSFYRFSWLKNIST